MKKITALFLLSLCLWPYGMHAFFVKNLTGHDVLLAILPEHGHAPSWVAVAPTCLRGFETNVERDPVNYQVHVCVVSHSNVPFMTPRILSHRSYSIKEHLTEKKVLVVQEEVRTITFTVADVEDGDRQLGLITKWFPCQDENGNAPFSVTDNHRERPNAR